MDYDELRLRCLSLVHEKLLDDYKKEHPTPNDLAKVNQYATFLYRFNGREADLLRLLQSYVAHKKKVNDDYNETIINKEIKEWPAFVKKGNKYEPGKETVSAVLGESIEDLYELVKIFRKYLNFIDRIIDGKINIDKSGNEVDYTDFLDRYNEQISEYNTFRELHENLSVETVPDLLCYLVKSMIFITRFRGLKMDKVISPIEFNDGNIIFKIQTKLNKQLKELYATISDDTDYDTIEEMIRTMLENNFKDLSINMVASVETIKSTDKDNGEVYDKIGKVINNINGVNVDKNIRIAVGLYIVRTVVIEVEKLLAKESSKKSKLTVYIHI
jgi:hypothetical protein